MLQTTSVVRDVPKSLNQNALTYGESGPNSDAKSR